jgi:hypothetical protein
VQVVNCVFGCIAPSGEAYIARRLIARTITGWVQEVIGVGGLCAPIYVVTVYVLTLLQTGGGLRGLGWGTDWNRDWYEDFG